MGLGSRNAPNVPFACSVAQPGLPCLFPWDPDDPSTPISLVQSHLSEHSTAGMMAALSLYSSPMEEGNEVRTIHAGFEEETEVKFTSGNTVGKLLLESSRLRAYCHWSSGRAGLRPQKKERDGDSGLSSLFLLPWSPGMSPDTL